MRQLVGGPPGEAFETSTKTPAPPKGLLSAYASVLDFGGGCGRVARQMILQAPRPKTYLGIDLHQGVVDWCGTNLTSAATAFRFEHHDVSDPGFNPPATEPGDGVLHDQAFRKRNEHGGVRVWLSLQAVEWNIDDVAGSGDGLWFDAAHRHDRRRRRAVASRRDHDQTWIGPERPRQHPAAEPDNAARSGSARGVS